MPYIPALATALIALLIVLSKRYHGKHTCDPTCGIQKFHTAQTPRIGGVAIFIGLLTACLLSSAPEIRLLQLMLIASLPAFTAGLIEDLTKQAGVKRRLFATIISGATACWLTGYTLNHIDIKGIDTILLYLPVSIAFTIFAVAGMANATNIIDGFNGLASGTIIICFLSLGIIAFKVGDTDLLHLCITLAIVTAGFFIINFPLGKIFLGDSGAYLLGFMLAWTAVMLPMRNPTISPWAPFLICSYPIIETIYSMARRSLHKTSASQPDIAHLHSLIKINAINEYFPNVPKHLRNSMVAPLCWTLVLLSSTLAITNYTQTKTLIASTLAILTLYTLTYKRLSAAPTKHSALSSPIRENS